MIYCDTIIVKSKKKKKKPSKKLIMKKKIMETFKMNYKRDPIDDRDYKYKTMTPTIMEAASSLPSKIDHTKDMSPVKDQGNLGSCVAFAVTAMKEFQEKREHEAELAKGKPGRPKIYNYSEAWLYWNCKKIDPWAMEDEGTSIRYAMKVLQKIGIPTEKGWPYKDINDVNEIGKPKGWATLVARWALIDSYYRIDTLTELKVALADGPVAIGVPCFYEFFFPNSDGVISYPSNTNDIYGGHAICTVGYDDTKELIKFKNSWGRGWGKNGYAFLPYKYVEDFLWDAWVAKDLTVTTEMLREVETLQ
jgi:C1A family cysteine protease